LDRISHHPLCDDEVTRTSRPEQELWYSDEHIKRIEGPDEISRRQVLWLGLSLVALMPVFDPTRLDRSGSLN
jgi:hypothetical protein